VAELFGAAAGSLIDRIWPYDQPALMKHPWRYLRLFRNLRRERFDAVLTCHNPDNFSLSQALAGRFLGPRWLIGFDGKENARFYDLAVPSSTAKPYAEAMLDLWRAVDPGAAPVAGELTVPAETVSAAAREFPPAAGGILIWLGATGNKGLPPDALVHLHEQIRKHTELPVQFAAGQADAERLSRYPAWVGERTLIWKRPLTETAAFLSSFRLFVSGDTGPMHLAAALGLPTLAVFVGSNIRQYGRQEEDRHLSLSWKGTPDDRRVVNCFLEKWCAANPPPKPRPGPPPSRSPTPTGS
jgi:heptosyltransferase-2/heptosyltransferase-3